MESYFQSQNIWEGLGAHFFLSLDNLVLLTWGAACQPAAITNADHEHPGTSAPVPFQQSCHPRLGERSLAAIQGETDG